MTLDTPQRFEYRSEQHEFEPAPIRPAFVNDYLGKSAIYDPYTNPEEKWRRRAIKRNAKIALLVGIFGFFVPGLGVAALVIATVTLIKSERSGRPVATGSLIAAIVLGVLGLISTIIVFSFVFDQWFVGKT